MATAALINRDLRIVPLGAADIDRLDPVFDEQCDEWLDLLKWDYTRPSQMIRQVARQGELPGFAATLEGRVIGFAYYVIERDRCSFGDLYVSKQWRGMGADRGLAAAIFEELARSRRVRRIESQCVTVDNFEADDLFEERGLEKFERHYMMSELGGERTASLAASKPEAQSIELRPWREDDFAQAARIIHRSYQGQYDARINSQYRTEEGCAEILSILTDTPWCGDFLPQVSRMAARRSSGHVIGILIASRIAPGVGHIGQISIHPAFQKQGLGRRLLYGAMAEFERCGLGRVTLAVTGANTAAVNLYETSGFRSIHQWPVFSGQISS
ncbi:MAG TPA: GNAT family N-acetyltransferase [Blastocatellia bacterium]|jgi:ribosomal protein S18 acetylase RimI-like enzyme